MRKLLPLVVFMALCCGTFVSCEKETICPSVDKAYVFKSNPETLILSNRCDSGYIVTEADADIYYYAPNTYIYIKDTLVKLDINCTDVYFNVKPAYFVKDGKMYSTVQNYCENKSDSLINENFMQQNFMGDWFTIQRSAHNCFKVTVQENNTGKSRFIFVPLEGGGTGTGLLAIEQKP